MERPRATSAMKKRLGPAGRLLAGLAVTAAVLTGCQTQTTGTGMTLPSPRYLNYPPQYIPPSPPFPLPRELAGQEATAASALAGVAPGAAIPLPVPVPAEPGLPGGPVAPLPPPP